ncbi:Aldo/keto reductase [Pholiota conissans]|uniref:Aldo/keto reductase n=1 Tax=Pholiota conissans TaxID=109636 RepID=A0A9P5Z7R9_9AGAR|nr:Aldo/keto reductase [Pholiota conissans]
MASELALQSTVTLSSGHKMPLLGFGVFQNSDATPSVLEALKIGYRHVDTAQYYRNEAQVGEAVRKSGLNRSDVFITTKIMSNNHGYHSTQRGIADSLARMKFDYIDLFLIHDPLSGTQRRLETYQALLEAKATGRINSVGVSNYGVKHLEEIKTAGYELPSVNQIELHPFNQQTDIVKYCREHNIIVQAYCPLVHGKMNHPIILDLASKYKRDPAQILVRWSLQKGFVPLPKSERPARIESNANVYDFDLDVDDIHKLDNLNRGKAGSISWNPVDAP